jgi:hypothetical protein
MYRSLLDELSLIKQAQEGPTQEPESAGGIGRLLARGLLGAGVGGLAMGAGLGVGQMLLDRPRIQALWERLPPRAQMGILAGTGLLSGVTGMMGADAYHNWVNKPPPRMTDEQQQPEQ